MSNDPSDTNEQETLGQPDLSSSDWIYFYDAEGVAQQDNGRGKGKGSGYGGLTYKNRNEHQGVDACILYDEESRIPLKQVKVRAVCNGTIIAFGVNHPSMGNWVVITSKDEYEVAVKGQKMKCKLTTRYLHMQYPLLAPADFWTEEMIKAHANNVRWEDKTCQIEISQGTTLGFVGSQGAKIGDTAIPHLHFDINTEGLYWGNNITYEKNTVDPQEMYPGVKFPCDPL